MMRRLAEVLRKRADNRRAGCTREFCEFCERGCLRQSLAATVYLNAQ